MPGRHPLLNPRRWARALTIGALAVPMLVLAQPRRPEPQQWQDVRHGHRQSYPVTGHRVDRLPARASMIARGNSRYWFADGVWYAPQGSRYVVTRPPYGVVVVGLPALASVLTIGAITYYYANNVYYRPVAGGRYEVVAAPVEEPAPAVASERVFVYPRMGQTAQQQASDQYECHRWAVGQSGFDPTTVVTVGAQAIGSQREDYGRASAACMGGRGYTVR